MLQRYLLHRRGGELTPSTGGHIGLGIHSHHLVLALEQPLQGRNGEGGCAHEYDAHVYSLVALRKIAASAHAESAVVSVLVSQPGTGSPKEE